MRFPDIQSSIRYKVMVLCGLVALAAPFMMYNLNAGMCGWPEGLSTRSSTFAAPRYFGWAEVSKVLAGCSGKGRDQSGVFVTLIMQDGTIISVPLNGGPKEAFHKLGQTLKDVPFIYDNSLDYYCNSENINLISFPPGR